jgi:hypothetical protein
VAAAFFAAADRSALVCVIAILPFAFDMRTTWIPEPRNRQPLLPIVGSRSCVRVSAGTPPRGGLMDKRRARHGSLRAAA